MKKFLLLAAMVIVCAGAANAQTGQQGQGSTPSTGDNASSSNREGRKYGAASEPGSDGSRMTVANPNGRSSTPSGPSSTTSNGSVSPATERLNNDVKVITNQVQKSPRRRR